MAQVSQSGNVAYPSSHSLHFSPLTLGLQEQVPKSSQFSSTEPSTLQLQAKMYKNCFERKCQQWNNYFVKINISISMASIMGSSWFIDTDWWKRSHFWNPHQPEVNYWLWISDSDNFNVHWNCPNHLFTVNNWCGWQIWLVWHQSVLINQGSVIGSHGQNF